MKKAIIIVLIVLALAGIGFYFYNKKKAAVTTDSATPVVSQGKPEVPPVDIMLPPNLAAETITTTYSITVTSKSQASQTMNYTFCVGSNCITGVAGPQNGSKTYGKGDANDMIVSWSGIKSDPRAIGYNAFVFSVYNKQGKQLMPDKTVSFGS